MSDAPLSTPFLGMGRPMVDRETLEAEGVQPSVIEAIMALVGLAAAMGHAGAKEGDGESYQNVVCRFIDPDWVFYGARPDTPLNPDVIPGLAGGGEITVELDNTLVHAAATILNFSTNFTVVDAGGGQVDIDVTGGGGGGSSNSFETWAVVTSADVPVASIVADSATDTVTLKEGFAIDIIPNAGLDRIQFVFLNGDGLEDDGSGNCRVKAHTYIDVTSSGVAVDFTEVASYNGASDQYLRNNAGTFQWATLPAADGVGYDEIQEEGTPLTKRAKLNFIGASVTAADDAGNSRTNVTITSGGGIRTVVITADIAAAAWNAGTGKLDPEEVTDDVFEWEADAPGYSYDNTAPVTVYNWYVSPIEVTAGKGKIAHISDDGRIISVDCNEITL